MNEIFIFFIGLLPTIITGSILFYIQRAQKKRDEKAEKRASSREKEMLVMIELELASAKLSYATAMAIKRGTPNGEVEEGLKQYNKALNEFKKFEREQIAKL